MITKPTVLVLGAGASIPYGYPSGTVIFFVKSMTDLDLLEVEKVASKCKWV